jgi:hypothetical protein
MSKGATYMTFNDVTGMNPGQIRSGLQIPYDPAYGFVWPY